FKASGMEGVDQGLIQLQQGFATGADHIGRTLAEIWPEPGHLVGNRLGRIVAAAEAAIGAHEIRIAEIADRRGAILLPPGPEIALAEAAEHRRSPRMGPFALQAVEHFLDTVHNGLRWFRREAGRPRHWR